MVKSIPNTPSFLLDRLGPKRIALVREQYPKWLPSAMSKFGKDLTGNMEHAHHFMKHLAKKDKAFKGIKLGALWTTQIGSGQIYDYVRKHLGKHDEKPVTTSI